MLAGEGAGRGLETFVKGGEMGGAVKILLVVRWFSENMPVRLGRGKGVLGLTGGREWGRVT